MFRESEGDIRIMFFFLQKKLCPLDHSNAPHRSLIDYTYRCQQHNHQFKWWWWPITFIDIIANSAKFWSIRYGLKNPISWSAQIFYNYLNLCNSSELWQPFFSPLKLSKRLKVLWQHHMVRLYYNVVWQSDRSLHYYIQYSLWDQIIKGWWTPLHFGKRQMQTVDWQTRTWVSQTRTSVS